MITWPFDIEGVRAEVLEASILPQNTLQFNVRARIERVRVYVGPTRGVEAAQTPDNRWVGRSHPAGLQWTAQTFATPREAMQHVCRRVGFPDPWAKPESEPE